ECARDRRDPDPVGRGDGADPRVGGAAQEPGRQAREPGPGLPHRDPAHVSQRREALIARYRAISLERLRSIRGKLEAVAEGNAEALADVRRELHTLKGDSHLLGLVLIGKVAHACEERLLDPRTLGSAVGALGEARDTMHDVELLRSDLDEIVSSAWALRLSPVHPTLAELGEYALELARTHGKPLRVRIDDGGALVERRLLDEVHEPLLHLV